MSVEDGRDDQPFVALVDITAWPKFDDSPWRVATFKYLRSSVVPRRLWFGQERRTDSKLELRAELGQSATMS
jgi:hypothetical protein